MPEVVHVRRVGNLDGIAERPVEVDLNSIVATTGNLIDEDQDEDVDTGVEALRSAIGGNGQGWMVIGVRAAKKGSVILNILWTKGMYEIAKITTPKRAVASGR